MWPVVAARLVPQVCVPENVLGEANAGLDGGSIGSGRVVSAAAARHGWSGLKRVPLAAGLGLLTRVDDVDVAVGLINVVMSLKGTV